MQTTCRVVADYYCSDETELQNPLVSPVFANVAGLPPTFIQVGDDEILLSDSTRFADKIEGRRTGCRARNLARNVARVPAVRRQDAGKPTSDQAHRRLPLALVCRPPGRQKPDCFCESSYILVRNERIAGSASSLLMSFCFSRTDGHVLDGSFAVDQGHDERVNLRRHRLGSERRRQWHGLLASHYPVRQGFVAFRLCRITLLVGRERKHLLLPSVAAGRGAHVGNSLLLRRTGRRTRSRQRLPWFLRGCSGARVVGSKMPVNQS